MICRICGQDKPGKSNTCQECKQNYPFKPSGQNQYPFNRKELWMKDEKKRKSK